MPDKTPEQYRQEADRAIELARQHCEGLTKRNPSAVWGLINAIVTRGQDVPPEVDLEPGHYLALDYRHAFTLEFIYTQVDQFNFNFGIYSHYFDDPKNEEQFLNPDSHFGIFLHSLGLVGVDGFSNDAGDDVIFRHMAFTQYSYNKMIATVTQQFRHPQRA